MKITFRIRLRRCLSSLTALVAALTLGALAPMPAQASTAATFTNPAAIQGQTAYGGGQNVTPITVSAAGTPTGSVYPSTISIDGAQGQLSYLQVTLNFNHTAPDDLDVLLVSPSGRTVVLMSDAGGYTDVNAAIGFKTGDTTLLPDTTAITNGWYAATNYVGNDVAGDFWPAPAPAVADPNASLTSLIGDSPNGTWKLFVRDDQDQDGGAVTSWTLSMDTDAVPTPAATYPSGVAVSGLSGTVSDVDVTLGGIDWHYINGLDAMLVAPDGRKAMLLSDVGGYNHVTDITLTLDDEAGTTLSDVTPPTSGRYRPTNIGGGDTFPAPAPNASTAGTPLSVFDGGNPNGTWKLYVVQDESDPVAGLISAGWSLRITTTGSSAPSISSTTPAAHATGVRRSADIRATASKALRPGSVTGKTVYLTRAGSSRHIAATVGYLAGSHTILIDPSRQLKAGTKYRVVVTTGVRDTAGTRLDQDPSTAGVQQKTWKFRTR
jgi:subtilisin-like proprotein convertase family protein